MTIELGWDQVADYNPRSIEHASQYGCVDSTRFAYLEAMGIQVWVRRSIQPQNRTATSFVATPKDGAQRLSGQQVAAQAEISPISQDDAVSVASMDWVSLLGSVTACTLCELHKTRTQTVFGAGSRESGWLFIGEAPGADEDRQGEPFVGRAGQLLNNMIRSIGLRREKVYIANILKCRPPKNRDPRPEESLACRPYLHRQIELLSPKIIITLGRIAAQNLLQTDTPIGEMRGRKYFYENSGIPVIVTYHPAYLLRSPREKRKAWQDLQLALKLVS